MTKKIKKETKELIVNQETKPARIYTREEAINELNRYMSAPIDPDYIIDEFRKKVLPKIKGDNKKEQDQALDEFKEKANQYAMALGLSNHYHVAETTQERRQPLILAITRELLKEYDCKTTSEITLAEMAAIHYGRVLTFSSMLAGNTQGGSAISMERNGYYTFLGKEIERASRQYLATLSALKQFKNPPFEINVKAKTAFVSQNQQINATNNVGIDNETIEPK